MTKDDLNAATELMETENTLDRLSSKVGKTDRDRHKMISAVLFLQTLLHFDGTFVWKDGPKRGDKHANVFEAMAAAMPECKTMGLTERFEHIAETAPKLRAGFYGARKYLDEWFLSTVYAVPQKYEAGMHAVLTIDPDFELECGVTAAKMQADRDVKLAEGQVNASVGRLASTMPAGKIRVKLEGILKRAMIEVDHRKPSFPGLTHDNGE